MQQNAATLVPDCTMANLLVLSESLSISSFYTELGGKDIG
jgi:hypothetical protein